MNISRSKVRFMQDGKVYTFLQKDEDSGLRFYYDGEYINLVTKNEVLINMPDVTYLNNHRIFYYLHGQCIQLAVYEDIIGGSYTLTFNNAPTLENNTKVTTYDNFTTALKLDVIKTNATIDYTDNNTHLTLNDYVEPISVGTNIKLVTTEYIITDIDMTGIDVTNTNAKVGKLLSKNATYTVIELEYSTNTESNYTLTETESTSSSITLSVDREITHGE